MEGCNIIIIHNPSAKDAYGSPYMQGTYPYRRHTAFPISTYMLRYTSPAKDMTLPLMLRLQSLPIYAVSST